jgi:hypothetical protein
MLGMAWSVCPWISPESTGRRCGTGKQRFAEPGVDGLLASTSYSSSSSGRIELRLRGDLAAVNVRWSTGAVTLER